jgi:integrase/recombinase XerD
MTPLRKRMLDDLQLRGMSARPQERSVRAVHHLADSYHKSPDHITEEALRQYFLSLKNVTHPSRSARTIALCGMQFFYEHPRKREGSTLTFVRAPRPKKLPVILSVDRGAHPADTPPAPARSGVPDHHVFVWSPAARRHPPAGS